MLIILNQLIEFCFKDLIGIAKLLEIILAIEGML